MSAHQPARSPDLLSANASLLLLVDLQDRLWPVVDGKDKLLENCRKLTAAAGLFAVPVAVTEQYPQGLGATLPALAETLAGLPSPPQPATKLQFSAADATGWPPAGERTDEREWAVVAGIETHVCVMQTALDLLSRGYRVAVPADAVSSRNRLDHEIALQRLRDLGVTIVTTESVLFEWCERAGTDQFRSVRHLVTGR